MLMSTDEIIVLIAKKLNEMDGVSLEDIANKILADKTVNYQGDSVFSVN